MISVTNVAYEHTAYPERFLYVGRIVRSIFSPQAGKQLTAVDVTVEHEIRVVDQRKWNGL